MPVLFEIHSESATYPVRFETNILADTALAEFKGAAVIADGYFAARLTAAGIPTIAVASGETSKRLDHIGEVIVAMRALGVRRDTHLWAIGGGTIQDVAGFVASIYMRGLAWSYCPTTLLGMVDSCIGGKSSINVGDYKNIVGTFHPPAAVIIDATLTSSLNAEQRVAGLMEAAKICYCRGPETFARYLALAPRVEQGTADFEKVIALSLQSKQWFVEIDEFDRAERLLLNLGHTFGHALEAASHYQLSHGVAVGLGMLCAQNLSTALHDAAPGGPLNLLEAHLRSLLQSVPGLRDVLRAVDVPLTLERLKADKKHETRSYRVVTFDRGGVVKLIRLPKSAASDATISSAIGQMLESFR